MRLLLVLVGLFVVVGLVGGAYYFGTKQNVAPTAPVTSTTLPVQTTTPKPTGVVVPPFTPSADPNVKTFTSTDLGISFQYLETQNEEKFSAKQVGNKIYVYLTKDRVDQGQYVEIFPKDKNDDLKTAIEKKFLANYSKSDCFAQDSKNPVVGQPLPANYLIAQIGYPPNDSQDGPFWVNADKCPAVYTSTNGIAYFLMDSSHPDKFAFLSIGQYAINAGPNLAWQSTLKFL